MPALRVEHVEHLHAVDAAKQAVARAKMGEGPTFIEARVYRYRAHGGAGDDSKTGYRPIAEREAWEKLDPVESLYALLKGIDRRAMEQKIQEEILQAFEHALASADPTEEDLHRHVYAVG
jgi:TPP-dependent pyruvate/acetoin dehydrogenase alpha subunit